MDIINDNQEDECEVEGEVEGQTNKSIEIDQKYFTKDKKLERSPEIVEKSPAKEEKSSEKNRHAFHPVGCIFKTVRRGADRRSCKARDSGRRSTCKRRSLHAARKKTACRRRCGI